MRHLYLAVLLLAGIVGTGCSQAGDMPTPSAADTPAAPVDSTPEPTPTATLTPTPTLTAPVAELLQGRIVVIGEGGLYTVTNGEVARLPGPEGHIDPISLSPDRTRIAYWNYNHDLLTFAALDTLSTLYETKTGHPATVNRIVWAPDSIRAVVQRDCIMDLVDTSSGESIEIFNGYIGDDPHKGSGLCVGPLIGASGKPENLVWSPDGTRLAFDIVDEPNLPEYVHQLTCERTAHLVVLNVDGSGLTQIDDNGSHPFWSAHDGLIYYLGGIHKQNSFVYCDFELHAIAGDGSGEAVLAARTDGYLPFSSDYAERYAAWQAWEPVGGKVAFDPGTVFTAEGNRIAWKGESSQAFVSSPDGSGQIGLGDGYMLFFSPCGDRIVMETAFEEWSISSLDGSPQTTTSSIRMPVFSPDCARVVFTNNGVMYSQSVTGEDVFALEGFDAEVWEILAWLPLESESDSAP